jgi:hypothetical protein
MNPWELKESSSGFVEGASAVGFGVPVSVPVAESGGIPTSDGGFVEPLVEVPPCGAIVPEGAMSPGDGGGGRSGSAAPPPGVDGCAHAGRAKVTTEPTNAYKCP